MEDTETSTVERLAEQFAESSAPASGMATGAEGVTEEWQPTRNGRWFVARTSGVSGVIWRKHPDETVAEARERDNQKLAGKKKPDPKPGTKQKSRASKTGTLKATSEELEKFLAELLSMPAVPTMMLLQCEYCAKHFATQGPLAAHQLVELSADNPALRRFLERMYTSWTALTYGSVLAMYIGKPLLHHVAPEPVFEAVNPVLHMPPRERVVPIRTHPRYKGPNTPHYAATPDNSPNGTDSTPPAA